MSTKPNPVIFIHGLWIHASAWQPWIDLFHRAAPRGDELMSGMRCSCDAAEDDGRGPWTRVVAGVQSPPSA